MKRLFVIALVLIASLAQAADYYVSVNGDDTHDGSQSTPWRTVDKAFHSVSSGDTIHILSGTYIEDEIATQVDGPIVVEGQSDLSSIIKGRWFLQNNNYIFRYLFVQGDEPSVGVDSMFFLSGDDITIEHCQFYKCGHGIEMVPADSDPQAITTPARAIIRNNEFSNGTQNGFIMLKGPNYLVENNLFRDGDGWDALRVWGVNGIIRKNTFQNINHPNAGDPNEDNHADIMQTFQSSDVTHARGIIFEKNEVINCSAQFGNSTAYLPTGPDEMGDWTIRNNLLINSRAQFNNYIPEFKFYNNTVYNNTYTSGFRFAVGGTQDGDRTSAIDGEVYNNLFIHCVSSYAWSDVSTKPASDHNFVTDETDGPSNEEGITGEPNGITGDYLPSDLFIDYQSNNFHLKEGAPAIDQGTTISSFNDDMDGNIRPIGAAWDIGCYEGASSNAPPLHHTWEEVDQMVTDVQNAQPLPTTRKVPPGGTTNQILQKDSDTDGDTGWHDASTTPVTQKWGMPLHIKNAVSAPALISWLHPSEDWKIVAITGKVDVGTLDADLVACDENGANCVSFLAGAFTLNTTEQTFPLTADGIMAGTRLGVQLSNIASATEVWLDGHGTYETGIPPEESCTTPQNCNQLNEGWMAPGPENTWTINQGTFDQQYTLTGTPPTESCSLGLHLNSPGDGSLANIYHSFAGDIDPTVSNVDVTIDIQVKSLDSPDASVQVMTLTTAAGGDYNFMGDLRVGNDTTGDKFILYNSEYYINLNTWYKLFIHYDTVSANSYFTINGGAQQALERTADNAFNKIHLGKIAGSSRGIEFEIGYICVSVN